MRQTLDFGVWWRYRLIVIFCFPTVEDQKEREKELIEQEMIPTERKNLTFFDKLYELQYKMIFNNQENVAGHMYASEPFDWLTLKRGVAYWISPTSNVSWQPPKLAFINKFIHTKVFYDFFSNAIVLFFILRSFIKHFKSLKF